MTKEEYKERTGSLYKEYQNKQRQLDVEFALSNNEVKIGDVVSDSCSTIIVEDIRVDSAWAWAGHLPMVYFYGTRITKKFVPFKSGEKATIYNVKNHIKSEGL